MHTLLGILGPALAILGLIVFIVARNSRADADANADAVRDNLTLTVRRTDSGRHAGPRVTFAESIANGHSDSHGNRAAVDAVGSAA